MENQKNDSLLRKAQAIGEDIKEMEAIDNLASYNNTLIKIKANRRKKVYNQMMRYAAFLTLPLLLSSLFFGYFYFKDTSSEIQYAEVTAAKGSVIRYELPDHSIVWLNSGSTLRYPTVFHKDNRKVDLKGEAYFEVQADPKRPFYVNTPGGLSLYVYGTQFNVSAYEDENEIETVLEKGKVNVICPEQKTYIKLKPGEHLLYNKENRKYIKSEIDVYEKIAWKDSKLIFRNTSLKDVLKRLSRHFNVDIVLNNVSGKEYKYRATFRDETLSQILDYLGKSASMKWRAEDAVQQANETFTKKRIYVNLY